MSFQKCPRCDGVGGIFDLLNHTGETCPTCNGKAIINDITGLPPSNEETKTAASSELSSEELAKPFVNFQDLTEEEIQFWSVPFFEELQAKKQMEQQLEKAKKEIESEK